MDWLTVGLIQRMAAYWFLWMLLSQLSYFFCEAFSVSRKEGADAFFGMTVLYFVFYFGFV